MKQRIQEIGMGGGNIFDDPGPDPKKGKWTGRMGWKPSGNPRLHPDEEAALAAGQPDTGPELPPESSEPFEQPMNPTGRRTDMPRQYDPRADTSTRRTSDAQLIKHGSRIHWTPTGQPSEKPGLGAPDLGREMTDQDIDGLIQAYRAEQTLPPHKQNSARLAHLKSQITSMMSQQEAQWVQRQAQRLLPKLNS